MKAAKLSARIDELKSNFEQEMSGKNDATKPVVVSEDLAAGIRQMTEALKEFRAGSPPPAIPVHGSLADSLAACATGLPDVRKQIEAHQYIEGKTLIAGLLGSAATVGPNTSAAVDVLQKQTTSEIRKFEVLRDEAKLLKTGGKTKEALIKYREAWAVMPDKDVAAQIEALKK